MARATIDPNIFLPTASAGTAENPADRNSAFYSSLIAKVNEHANALDAAGIDVGASATETVTSGALDVDTPTTFLSVTGTQAYTLADGDTPGQRKTILCTVAASIPVGTLTITSPETTAGMVCSSTFVFNTVGQQLELVWSGTKWRVVRTRRAGVVVAVLATTVLTGYHLNHNISCSVDGTKVSATTRGVPDGQYPGDMVIVSCSSATNIPVGSITFTGLTLANVAATDLQAIGATTDTVTLTWNGSAWLVIANSGITVA